MYASLNRLTVFRFKQIARRAGFEFAYFHLRPFLGHPGNEFAVGLVSALRHPPRLKNLWAVLVWARREFTIGTFLLFSLLSAISPLILIPIAQEIATGGCKAVLRKG